MSHKCQHIRFRSSRKIKKIHLAFFWGMGLVCGAWMFRSTGNSSSVLFHSAASSCAHLTGLLLCAFLPLLLSMLVVHLRTPELLNGICFCKAFSLSFVSSGVASAYGQSGWLVQCLLLFSDMLSVAVLYFFWLRYGAGERKVFHTSALGYIFVLFLIVCTDYHFIFPLLRRVISL